MGRSLAHSFTPSFFLLAHSIVRSLALAHSLDDVMNLKRGLSPIHPSLIRGRASAFDGRRGEFSCILQVKFRWRTHLIPVGQNLAVLFVIIAMTVTTRKPLKKKRILRISDRRESMSQKPSLPSSPTIFFLEIYSLDLTQLERLRIQTLW